MKQRVSKRKIRNFDELVDDADIKEKINKRLKLLEEEK
jgi:hypothetical protein